MTGIRMTPYGELRFKGGGEIEALTMWGVFSVPMDVWVRSLRLDRRYPGNYADGYLGAWCKRQGEMSK